MEQIWKHYNDQQVEELYVDRLFSDYGHECSVDEIYALSDKKVSVSMTFGSTLYEFIPNRFNDGTAYSVFLHNACVLFAHCFNEQSGGGQFLLLTEKDSPYAWWSGHCLAVVDDETFFDVTGKRSLCDIEEDYPHSKFSYEVISESELWERKILSSASYSHPSEWVDELERAYVYKVVETVKRRAGL